jgi:hypothetical protein
MNKLNSPPTPSLGKRGGEGGELGNTPGVKMSLSRDPRFIEIAKQLFEKN